MEQPYGPGEGGAPFLQGDKHIHSGAELARGAEDEAEQGWHSLSFLQVQPDAGDSFLGAPLRQRSQGSESAGAG